MQDDSAADLAAFGAPSDVIESIKTSPDDTLFGVWEENAETVIMFMRLQTQWNITNGGFVGLNYSSVEFLIRIHDVQDAAAMMDDLQAMELAALQLLNKRKD